MLGHAGKFIRVTGTVPGAEPSGGNVLCPAVGKHIVYFRHPLHILPVHEIKKQVGIDSEYFFYPLNGPAHRLLLSGRSNAVRAQNESKSGPAISRSCCRGSVVKVRTPVSSRRSSIGILRRRHAAAPPHLRARLFSVQPVRIMNKHGRAFAWQQALRHSLSKNN